MAVNIIRTMEFYFLRYVPMRAHGVVNKSDLSLTNFNYISIIVYRNAKYLI